MTTSVGERGGMPPAAGWVPRPDHVVFEAAGFAWTRAHVVDLAGGLRFGRLERRLVLALAAEQVLEAAGDEVGAAEVRAATEGVRRARNLLTRDETVDWLAGHDLGLDDLVAYGRRVAARRRVGLDRAAAAAITATTSAPWSSATDAVRWAEATCVGAVDAAALELADLVAAWAEADGGADRPDGTAGTGRPGLGDLVAARRRQRLHVCTERALRAAIERHHFEWTVLEGDQLVFDAVDGAAEARLCLLDGTPAEVLAPFAAVAAPARLALGDLDAAFVGSAAGATPGEVVGPYPCDDGWAVLAVAQRADPTLDDVAVRRAAESLVVGSAERRARDRQVRWHGP